MYRYVATVLGRRRAGGLKTIAGAAREGAPRAARADRAAGAGPPAFDLRVRVDGPALPGLCPPGAPPVREVTIRRRGPAAAFRRGAAVVLTPAEGRALFAGPPGAPGAPAEAGEPSEVGDRAEPLRGEERLIGPWLEAALLPHLGGRVSRVALRASGFAPLALAPVVSVERGCEPGGISDSTVGWKVPLPTWAARYRSSGRGARAMRVRGRAGGFAFERAVEVSEAGPLLVIEGRAARAAASPRGGARGAGPRGGGAPRYEARIVLRSRREAPLRFLWPEGAGVGSFRALPDPASFHPARTGFDCRVRLAAGALVAAAGERGATVLFADPARLGWVEVFEERGRALVRVRAAEKGEPLAYALALCERVAVGPRGVLGAAAAPADADGLARVALVLRDLDAPGDGPVEAEVGGRAVVLAPRALGAAGRLHVGEVRLPLARWREAATVARVAGGEYVL